LAKRPVIFCDLDTLKMNFINRLFRPFLKLDYRMRDFFIRMSVAGFLVGVLAGVAIAIATDKC
jgi:uncharacterized membrane protein (DUF106 family)